VPLVFITFLENAFKHGVSNNHPGAWVDVMIRLREKKCFYVVENSKVGSPDVNAKAGIGLQNVRRRLELSYPEKHTLVTTDLPDRYKVELEIQLS
jgi:two-component system, LytTR family, sensor histidine kinase AlgZ